MHNHSWSYIKRYGISIILGLSRSALHTKQNKTNLDSTKISPHDYHFLPLFLICSCSTLLLGLNFESYFRMPLKFIAWNSKWFTSQLTANSLAALCDGWPHHMVIKKMVYTYSVVQLNQILPQLKLNLVHLNDIRVGISILSLARPYSAILRTSVCRQNKGLGKVSLCKSTKTTVSHLSG